MELDASKRGTGKWVGVTQEIMIRESQYCCKYCSAYIGGKCRDKMPIGGEQEEFTSKKETDVCDDFQLPIRL